jgi:CAAX protease family protein
VPAINEPESFLDSNLVPSDGPSSLVASPPVDPNNPPWGFAGAFLVWFASLLLLFFIPVLFLVPYALHRGLNPANPEFVREMATLALSDKTAVLLQVLALLPIHLLTFAMVWALVTRFGKLPFLPTIGWGWPPRLRFWPSVGLGVLLFIVGSTIAKLLGGDKPTQLEQIINSSIAARYAIAFLAVFTAPFVEEFIYRGVLYAALQRAVGTYGAVVFVLGLFTIIHVPQYWPNLGVIAAVGLLSISLTIVRAYTGRLLPCVVIHLVFNGITSVLLLVEPHYQRLTNSQQAAALLLKIAQLTS